MKIHVHLRSVVAGETFSQTNKNSSFDQILVYYFLMTIISMTMSL